MHFDDEPWDENEWERFLRERDQQIDRSMRLLNDFLEKHPRPDDRDAEALAVWKERLRAFVDAKGWTPGDMALPFIWLDEADAEEEEPAQRRPGEEVPLGFEDDAPFPEEPLEEAQEDFDPVERVPVYRQALDVTGAVIDWSHGLPTHVKDGTLVQFCALVTQIPAKVAKGHGLGFERDMIGGNIACVKRSLAAANQALGLLAQMKGSAALHRATYQQLYEALFELRNALGLYVQELRAQFDLGID